MRRTIAITYRMFIVPSYAFVKIKGRMCFRPFLKSVLFGQKEDGLFVSKCDCPEIRCCSRSHSNIRPGCVSIERVLWSNEYIVRSRI